MGAGWLECGRRGCHGTSILLQTAVVVSVLRRARFRRGVADRDKLCYGRTGQCCWFVGQTDACVLETCLSQR